MKRRIPIQKAGIIMQTDKINIRDPYILLYEGKYYLYGTRSATCWGPADGFDCYISDDLKDWKGPVEIFKRPEGFFADQNYWAPECVYQNGFFYLITTLGSGDRKKGIYVLKSDKPEGPYEVFSGKITPEDWCCIDGTVYFEDETPWLVFSHSFEDTPNGDMCALPLTSDLKSAAGEPVLLFSAVKASWAKPFPYAKAEFGMDGDVYFTDGPCLFKENEKLYMTWSSWGEREYAVGIALSESGTLKGPWSQQDIPLYPADGGHGMVFRDKDGTLIFTLHEPNEKYKEHPAFYRIVPDGGSLKLENYL